MVIKGQSRKFTMRLCSIETKNKMIIATKKQQQNSNGCEKKH